MNNEVKGEIARELQERNRHIDIATARYYVDAVCDLLSRYGQASGQALDARTLYYELVGIDEDIRHGGLVAFDQTCLNTLRRVMRALADAAFSPNQAASAEPVYAYRRKGMDNFTTCTRERFEELQDKPHLFETRIFYAAPVAAQAPKDDFSGVKPPRSSEGSEVLDLPFHRRVVFEGRRHPLPDLHREDAMSNIELKVARTYRAKKPRESRGFVNDRTVIYIGTNFVQYDGPAVGVGRRYSKVSTSDFLKWADRDVTDELPDGEYAPWPPAKLEAAPDAKPAAHPLRPAAPHLSDIEHPEQHARADSPESDGETFAAWLAREIPPGTVISNPAWWAPRILRAALRATPQPAAQAAPAVPKDTPEAIEGTIQVLKECGGFTEQAPVIRQLRRYATLLAALTTQGESHVD